MTLDPDARHTCNDPECSVEELTNVEAAFVSRALAEIVANSDELDALILHDAEGRAYIVLVRVTGTTAIPLGLVWMPGMLDVLRPFLDGSGGVN